MECQWFTYYGDGSQELPSLCLLLQHCDSLDVCEGCISGPRDGRDVEECFPGETDELTTNGQCGMFHEAACDITEYNTVEVKHGLSPAQCQAEWRTLIGRAKGRYCALIGGDHHVAFLAMKTQ